MIEGISYRSLWRKVINYEVYDHQRVPPVYAWLLLKPEIKIQSMACINLSGNLLCIYLSGLIRTASPLSLSLSWCCGFNADWLYRSEIDLMKLPVHHDNVCPLLSITGRTNWQLDPSREEATVCVRRTHLQVPWLREMLNLVGNKYGSMTIFESLRDLHTIKWRASDGIFNALRCFFIFKILLSTFVPIGKWHPTRFHSVQMRKTFLIKESK